MVLSDGPRLGHLRCDSGCRKDQGLTEKMARDSTNSGIWHTRATPLMSSLKAALTHKEPFSPQARQRDPQEEKLRTSKIKFRVSPRVLLSSTTPSWVIPATGALWVFLICLMPMMLPAAPCLSVGPVAALGMQGRQWEEWPWLPFSATHSCICNRRRAGEGLSEFVWM